MVVLPKFLYLFVNIPIILRQPFFNTLRGSLITLVWGGKKPHIKWEVLTLPYAKGGFRVPDMQLYYLCAQAQYASYWQNALPYTPHVAVEAGAVHPIPLKAMIVNETMVFEKDEIDTVQCTNHALRELGKRAWRLPLYVPAMPLLHHGKKSVTGEARSITFFAEGGCALYG